MQISKNRECKANLFLVVARTSLAVILFLLILLPLSIGGINADERGRSFDLLGVGTAVNTWLEKNPGITEYLSRRIKWRVFHVSPSDSISIGRNGWLYYTLDNNLEIASGKYPITENAMEATANQLLKVKKHYDSMGIELFYLLTPSQTSIYPEYVSGGNFTVGISPVDTMQRYLKERIPTLHVISPKQALIRDKESDLVFCKKDVHPTDLGLYTIYNSICQEISSACDITIPKLDVSFSSGRYMIGMNAIANIPNIFGEYQVGPVAQYTGSARQITQGEYYENIISITSQKKHNGARLFFYENPQAPIDKTVLIYGCSTFAFDDLDDEENQLTRFLAETFKNVVYFWSGATIDTELDEIVDPDIVILENAERTLDRNEISICYISKKESVPTVTENEAAFGSYDILRVEDNDIIIGGWIVAEGVNCDTQDVKIVLRNMETDESMAYTTESVQRPDVEETFQNTAYAQSGYAACIKKEQIPNGDYEVTTVVENGARTWRMGSTMLTITDNVLE